MKIMVSACLTGENCKYNGGNNRNKKIQQLMEKNDVIIVCPEQMGGLPTPRVPSEIRDGVVTARDSRIVDKEFRTGAAKCLEIAMREKPDLIVLQSRSPSCGVKQRYDGTFTGTLVDGAGVTAQLLMKNGFRCLDVKDLVEIHEGIVIRKMQPEETDLLKKYLYEAIFIPEGAEPPARDIVERPELKLYYEGFGSGRADHCLVAEADGRIIGAVWTRIMNDYGHVDDETPSFAISLLSEYRGQGIGTRLMRKMLSLLKEKGCRKASLAVQKANYAVGMYKNVGFEIMDENDEEYIMVCRLSKEHGVNEPDLRLEASLSDNKVIMKNRNKISAVILCGGKSRRMGTDKAMLTAEGTPNAVRLLRALSGEDSPCTDVWLSIGTGESYPDIHAQKVSDRFLGCGPMGGLEAALTVCREDYLFVTPVDTPFADVQMARELMMYMTDASRQRDAVLVVDGGGRLQTLLGIYHKRVLPALTQRLLDGRREKLRIRDFLRDLDVAYVNAQALTDGVRKSTSCNTPEEWQRLMEQESVKRRV